MQRAVHFVGFRGNEFVSAQRVWGRPDFIHRANDPRFRNGGELHPDDVVIFANNSENNVVKYSYDDSERF